MKSSRLKKSKKGLSQVIATILLILLSVAAVAILAAAIIPFVRESLSGGKECFEAVGLLEIDTEKGYTCYDSGEKEVKVMIKKAAKDVELRGIKIAIFDGTTGKTHDIETDLPGKGEERTYTIDANELDRIESVEIAPIMESGKTCDATDKAEIEECS